MPNTTTLNALLIFCNPDDESQVRVVRNALINTFVAIEDAVFANCTVVPTLLAGTNSREFSLPAGMDPDRQTKVLAYDPGATDFDGDLLMEAVLRPEPVPLDPSYGAGSVVVDASVGHNLGEDGLQVVYQNGNPMPGAVIEAYVKSEYDAGAPTLRGTTVTGGDGRPVGPLKLAPSADLDPPSDYYFVIMPSDPRRPTVKLQATVA